MTTEDTSLKNKVSPLSPASASNQRQDQQRAFLKTKRNNYSTAKLPKPNWNRVKVELSLGRFCEIKDTVRTNWLAIVCEEASCPNIAECLNKGTTTFVIMGDKYTLGRRVSDWSINFIATSHNC